MNRPEIPLLRESAAFAARLVEAVRALETRLQSPLQPLRSVAGVYQATPQLDAPEAKAAISAWPTNRPTPGVTNGLPGTSTMALPCVSVLRPSAANMPATSDPLPVA